MTIPDPPPALLITGSRTGAEALYPYIARAVAWAQARGWHIVVGDADGVDAAVIAECNRQGLICEVHGAYGRVKRHSEHGPVYTHPALSYPQRDRLLARRCTACLALWDGQSHGTRLTCEAAREFGKTVWVLDAQEPDHLPVLQGAAE